jgi:polynucleotide 5'-hydroxyl-kinase GRC3/NOL9
MPHAKPDPDARAAAPPEIPAAWRRSAAQIARHRWRTVLVLGATDRGKSTYCHFLARELCGAGKQVAFVDADIGQKDIGPPATVSLGRASSPAGLSAARLEAFYFVGHVNPVAHFLTIVIGTQRMVLAAADAPFVIVDTVGLIHGSGRALLGYQIEALEPDVIVALERDDELESVLRAQRHRRILRLPVSARAVAKSARARRALRERAFRAHFAGAQDLEFPLDALVFRRWSLLNGTPVRDARFLYAETTANGVIGVSEHSAPQHQRGLTVLPAGFERDLLCGVGDRANRMQGLGIINGIDFRRRTVSLFTAVPRRRVRVVQPGDMHLARDGRELRREHAVRP